MLNGRGKGTFVHIYFQNVPDIYFVGFYNDGQNI